MNLVLDISKYDKGIDLSQWVKIHNLWGVIIKAGGNEDTVGGRYRDACAESHLRQAVELGIHIGFYYYTDIRDPKFASDDADHFAGLIDELISKTGGYCDLPCYIDVEDTRQFGPDKSVITNLVKTFCERLKIHDRYPGVYTYASKWLESMNHDELMEYANWIAWWRGSWPNDLSDVGMWQQGAANLAWDIKYDDPRSSIYHDINWCIIDYPERIKNGLLSQPSTDGLTYQSDVKSDNNEKIQNESEEFKMGRASDVINAAYAELGYYAPDDPEPGSKYARWLADVTGEDWLRGSSREIAWCCCFVSKILDQAGVKMDGFPTQNTDLALNGGARKYAIPDKYKVRYGDIVIFNWDWNNTTDHIGFATGEFDGYGFPTIEGNVSNSVGERYRQMGNVAYVLRPPYEGYGVVGENIPSVSNDPKNNRDGGKLSVDGLGGWNTIIDLQHILGTTEDGVISGQNPQTYEDNWGMCGIEYGRGGSIVVSKLQECLGVEINGQWDAATSTALQQKLDDAGYDVDVDSHFGSESVMALQQAINDGKLAEILGIAKIDDK